MVVIEPTFGNLWVYFLLQIFGYPFKKTVSVTVNIGGRPDDLQIVNGNDVTFDEFSKFYNFTVFLADIRKERSFCTGIILAEQYVQVAAHCVEKKAGSYKNYRVYVGSNKLRGGKMYQLAQQYHMKNWKGHVKYGYDTMVLKLAVKIPFDDISHPASPVLFAERNDKSEDNCFLIGFGANKNEGRVYPDNYPKLLQKIQMPLINNKECKDIYGADKIINCMGCAGYEKGGHMANGCGGDSGASLMCLRNERWELVGTFSYNGNCQDVDIPQIITNITYPLVKQFLKKYRKIEFIHEV
uniref:Peptidase S1 domain-containing protein n=1 Tax=Panagrolaimus sp. PS1159 TaxID=55785 RepID=A0AC35F5P1_9BILA